MNKPNDDGIIIDALPHLLKPLQEVGMSIMKAGVDKAIQIGGADAIVVTVLRARPDGHTEWAVNWISHLPKGHPTREYAERITGGIHAYMRTPDGEETPDAEPGGDGEGLRADEEDSGEPDGGDDDGGEAAPGLRVE